MTDEGFAQNDLPSGGLPSGAREGEASGADSRRALRGLRAAGSALTRGRRASVEQAPQPEVRTIAPTRTPIMGILNVTPDSFSDGGHWYDHGAAIEHAITMVAQGADIIDVGGESTRPGAERVSVHEEQRRILPVIRELVRQGVEVSVDTMNSATASAAINMGAAIINDVSGGLADPNMVRVAVDSHAPFVVMHWRGHNRDDANSLYRAPAADVYHELEVRAAELIVSGVRKSNLILDPGLGFAKTPMQTWQVLAGVDRLTQMGLPVLVGASRKRFIGELLADGLPVQERDFASSVVAALAVQSGAWAVRVHNVTATRAALDVADAWRAAKFA